MAPELYRPRSGSHAGPARLEGGDLLVAVAHFAQPPRIGEHTGELLREVGYGDEEIAAFEARQAGIAR